MEGNLLIENNKWKKMFKSINRMDNNSTRIVQMQEVYSDENRRQAKFVFNFLYRKYKSTC